MTPSFRAIKSRIKKLSNTPDFKSQEAARLRSYRAKKKRAFLARLKQQDAETQARLQEIFDNGCD